MRAPPITPFALGSRVTVLFHGAVSEFGEVAKIGRRYVTVSLDRGREIQVHPWSLRREPIAIRE